MQYTLLINGGPESQSAETALEFAQALHSTGHSIFRLFFYQSGVLLAQKTSNPSSLTRRWQSFVEMQRLDAVVCITAAVRRGIVSDAESRASDATFEQIAPGFEVSGLGQFADALTQSQRLLSFG
ncbi:MAG: sulfurtransferase complex subunit TusD [Alcanivoracaceae bacterium]|nr:sulfurtransferase complex subunit TusD [Alcanivoracaceae bacterium]